MTSVDLKSDLDEIQRALTLLVRPGDMFEIRAFNAGPRNRQVMGGFFTLDTLDKAVSGVVELIEKHNAPGVYVTLNPVDSALKPGEVEANRIVTFGTGQATSDDAILRRQWLLIDCDPVRKSGISATDEEMRMAIAKAAEVMGWLKAQGFKDPLKCYSGNGGHGLYAVDLPNDEEATDLVKTLLEVLNARFGDDTVKVDTGVFNASRITKLYGTPAKKGDSTKDRPHRMSSIKVIPDWASDPEPDAGVTPRTVLETLVASFRPSLQPQAAKQTHSAAPGSPAEFDVRRFLSDHGFAYQERETSSKTLLNLEKCPFCNKTEGNPAVIELPTGMLLFKCQKDQCTDRFTWHDFREHFDPAEQRLRLTNEQAQRNVMGGWPLEGGTRGSTRGSDFLDSELESEAPAALAAPASPFPIDAIPDPLGKYLRDHGEAIGVPVDYLAAPSLSITGAVIGNRSWVQAKSSFKQYPILWTGVIGASGTAKSPALNAARMPLDILQREAKETFDRDLAQWEEEQGRDPSMRTGPLGQRPQMEILYTTDITPEALAEIADRSQGSV